MFPLAVMHKGREGVHQNVNVCEPKEGGLYQCKGSSINFGKAEIVVKSEKRSGTVLKGYHWIKRRAAEFDKSSITFWAKAVSQPKN